MNTGNGSIPQLHGTFSPFTIVIFIFKNKILKWVSVVSTIIDSSFSSTLWWSVN